MSYYQIKSIHIDEKNKVVNICSADSSLRPLIYSTYKSERLTEILQKEGKEKVEIEIMKDYFSGNYKGGGQKNRYVRAYRIARYMFPITYDFYSYYNNQEGENFENFIKVVLGIESFKNYYIAILYRGNQKYYVKQAKYSYIAKFHSNKATKYSSKEEATYDANIFLGDGNKYKYSYEIKEFIGGLK